LLIRLPFCSGQAKAQGAPAICKIRGSRLATVGIEEVTERLCPRCIGAAWNQSRRSSHRNLTDSLLNFDLWHSYGGDDRLATKGKGIHAADTCSDK
jgi:hypothetical protein